MQIFSVSKLLVEPTLRKVKEGTQPSNHCGILVSMVPLILPSVVILFSVQVLLVFTFSWEQEFEVAQSICAPVR